MKLCWLKLLKFGAIIAWFIWLLHQRSGFLICRTSVGVTGQVKEWQHRCQCRLNPTRSTGSLWECDWVPWWGLPWGISVICLGQDFDTWRRGTSQFYWVTNRTRARETESCGFYILYILILSLLYTRNSHWHVLGSKWEEGEGRFPIPFPCPYKPVIFGHLFKFSKGELKLDSFPTI